MENSKSKSNLVNAARSKDSLTANLATTHSTSLSNLVDMFFLAGASRNMSDEDIITLFQRAYIENPGLSLKCLFWARDIRQGAGERRFFRVIYDFIRKNYPDRINIHFLDQLIPEYGRWDDVWYNRGEMDTDLIEYLSSNLTHFKNGLLAKWLPRKGPVFEAMRKYMGYTPKEFRKILVELSNTVEQKMCAREFDKIEYNTVPSVAMNKYRKAFLKNDPERFNMFIENVEKGEDKIHADAIFPHSIIKSMLNPGGYFSIKHMSIQEQAAIIAQWNALPDYMKGSKDKILPICDVSGSMAGLPITVSVALGLYISEKNESIFRDAFITFSKSPTMQYLKGNVIERARQLVKAQWDMNTNLQAVFDLILTRGRDAGLNQEDMPTKILIISDMEFDMATRTGYGYSGSTNFEEIERKYYSAGYKRPQIVFWNVNGRLGNVPVQIGTHGTALISGFSVNILKNILSGELTTPETFVLKVLNSERYNVISEAI